MISSFTGLNHDVREAVRVGDSELAGLTERGSDPISIKARLFMANNHLKTAHLITHPTCIAAKVVS